MQIAILAGGLGTRLGEIAENTPKSLIRISNKPFLEYQIEFLKRAGIEDIILCTGHLGEQVERYFGGGKKYGVNIKYSREGKPLGTAGALKMAEKRLDDPFFTIYGDSYVFLDFFQTMSCFQSYDKLAMMTVYKNHNQYDRSNIVVREGKVREYSKGERTRGMVYIDYGVNIFRKGILEMVPENQFYSLEDLFPSLIEREQLLAYEVYRRFYEIGSPHGLAEFEQFTAERAG